MTRELDDENLRMSSNFTAARGERRADVAPETVVMNVDRDRRHTSTPNVRVSGSLERSANADYGLSFLAIQQRFQAPSHFCRRARQVAPSVRSSSMSTH